MTLRRWSGVGVGGMLLLSLASIPSLGIQSAVAQPPPPGFPEDPPLKFRLRQRGEARLQIEPPPETEVDRQATIRWRIEDRDVLDGRMTPPITWYYSRDPKGSDRVRVVTKYRDSFDGDVLDRWLPVNGARQNWEMLREPQGRRNANFMRIHRGGGPLVSLERFTDAFVVSCRVRPHGGGGIAVGASRDNLECYALRGAVELLNPQNPDLIVQRPLQNLPLDQWYWFELGVRKLKKRQVIVRARVWDARHERVLVPDLALLDSSGEGACPQGQRIALLPGADYSEVYVDPWEARWHAAPGGTMEWDTRAVPEGEYHLLAVVSDPRGGPPAQKASEFKIKVQH